MILIFEVGNRFYPIILDAILLRVLFLKSSRRNQSKNELYAEPHEVAQRAMPVACFCQAALVEASRFEFWR